MSSNLFGNIYRLHHPISTICVMFYGFLQRTKPIHPMCLVQLSFHKLNHPKNYQGVFGLIK
eukprot:UN21017